MITVAEEVERALQIATNRHQSDNPQSLMSTNMNRHPVNQQNFTSAKPNYKLVNHQSLERANLNHKLVCPANETTDSITLSSDEEEGVQDVNMGVGGGVKVKKKAKVHQKSTLRKVLNGTCDINGSSGGKFLKSKARKEKKSMQGSLFDLGNANLKA